MGLLMTGESPVSSESILRPSPSEALAAWRNIVAAERREVEDLPRRPRPDDFYGPVAETFRADPNRTDDPVLLHLLTLTQPDDTWIDVGAGGGRYSLAIARRVRRLYAVEPSPGMREVLVSAAQQYGIDNVDTIDERWPCRSSETPKAGVAFISHVGYDIEDIGPFLDQMEGHATRMCVAVLFEHAPTGDFAGLWEAVHGGKRTVLPGMREFIALLFARGKSPELSFVPLPGRTFKDLDALHAAAGRAVWVQSDGEEDARLAEAIRSHAVPSGDGFLLGAPERRVGIAVWRP